MEQQELRQSASKLADLTFKLLSSCHEKEERLATQQYLTLAEFRCLRQINEIENINNKEIAERMDLSASRLTRIIDGLVAKGYVIREIEPNDRRNMRLYLSENGKEFTRKLNDAYVDIHAQILGDIETGQHKPLITAMTGLLSAVEKWMAQEEK
ncbi:MAG: MarR family transcriptional regulator [Ignavibacteria bacterium]|nr:MarR family transcriptional regulator [Ignavibacteria bacterium]